MEKSPAELWATIEAASADSSPSKTQADHPLEHPPQEGTSSPQSGTAPTGNINSPSPPALGGAPPAEGLSLRESHPQQAPEPTAAPPPLLAPARPLEPAGFPNPPRSGSHFLPTTLSNVAYLLQKSHIHVHYDVIKKKIVVKLPNHKGSTDNFDNVVLTHILSLASLNNLQIALIPAYVEAIGDQNLHNPVAAWIKSKPWDGVDRLQEIYATLTVREEYPEALKDILIYRWLLSGVAAVFKPSGFKARGVLTLQGPQGIGKTSWLTSLVPDVGLREAVLKLDHHLDGSNKDSILGAICHWIVEIGELDSSFKKDIARLKGFLTSDSDKVRRPYARAESEYPRRTIFYATVNENNFLVDLTGNTRWWTIPVTAINYTHGIDMQQLFAQLAIDYEKGIQWWLTSEEEILLEEQNREHESMSVIRERLMQKIDHDRMKSLDNPAMTPLEVLQQLDFEHPTNGMCKECAQILRSLFGEPKRIKGQNKWRVPFPQSKYSQGSRSSDFTSL
jgi:putative DNA primase/helicase